MTDKKQPKKKRFTTYVHINTLAELQELSARTGIPVSRLVDDAIQEGLIKWNGKLKHFEK